jgi:hypothetical protein
LELSLLGQNLFDRSHGEFNAPPSRSEFQRGVFLGATWSRNPRMTYGQFAD